MGIPQHLYVHLDIGDGDTFPVGTVGIVRIRAVVEALFFAVFPCNVLCDSFLSPAQQGGEIYGFDTAAVFYVVRFGLVQV
jgi:hypothetical protein